MTAVFEKPVAPKSSRLIRRLIEPNEAQRLLNRSVRWPEGFSLADLSVARVFPSKGGGVGAQWDIRLNGPRQLPEVCGSVYAMTNHVARADFENRAIVSTSGPFPISNICCGVKGTDVLLNTPDRDACLSAIVDATSGQRVRERLTTGRIGRLLGDSGRWECSCLNYRPRRRCVLRYRRGTKTGRPFVVGKLYRNGQALRVPQLIRETRGALAHERDVDLTIPRVLRVWRDWNMVVFEGVLQPEMNGHPVNAPSDMAQAAGSVLATLHRLPARQLPSFTPADEIIATGRWVALAKMVNRMNPCAERVWSALRRWHRRIGTSSTSLVHRDFYDSQLLQTRQGWAIVDFDTAARGDREQDIGNYISHLTWDCVREGLSNAVWAEATAMFLESYHRSQMHGRHSRRSKRADGIRLRFYLVSSLLRVGIIHGLRTGTTRSASRMHKIADAMRQAPPSRLLAMLCDASGRFELRC